MTNLNQNLRVIERGALLKIPGELVTDPKGLLDSLTFPNPEYRNAQMFGRARAKNGFVFMGKKIPKDLFFYSLDKTTREISLPRNIDLAKYVSAGVPLKDCTSLGKELGEFKNPLLKLRDYQEDFIENEFKPALKSGETDFLLLADCGGGKTFTGLYAASILKRRVLAVVTTNTIAKQWVETVQNVYTGWTVNKITGQKTNTEVDVVVATYSLLSDSAYGKDFFDQFGTIIFDEYHRAGASSYNEILKKASCKYRISLTATFRRKDNLHKVLAMHVGSTVKMHADMMKARVYPTFTRMTVELDKYKKVGKPTDWKKLRPYTEIMVVDRKSGSTEVVGTVYDLDLGTGLVDVDGTWYDYREFMFCKLGEVVFADVETAIADDVDRKTDILRLIYWGRKNGRKILLLSNRKSLLYSLYKSLWKRCKVGVMVSDKAKEQQRFCRALGIPAKEYEEMVKRDCTVILGIDKIAKEGLDIPKLDMLIYAYAESDVEQSVGRICRNLPGKPEPIAFYLLDDSPVHKKRFYDKKKGALNMFLDLGHRVEDEIHIEHINKVAI